MAVKTVPAKPHVRCEKGARCLYARALALHEAYRRALKSDTRLMRERRERLRMARFVQVVAEHAASGDPDVWENLLRADRKSDADSFANSRLRSEIDELEQNLTAAVESRAEALVAFLRRRDFQHHLVAFHRHNQIEDYGIYDDPESYSTLDFTNWRHIDHCVAVLTDQLAVSKAGSAFVERLVLDPPAAQGPAFKDVWGHVGKAKTVAGPLARFVYNVSPVLVGRIQRAVTGHQLTTVASVVADPDVREVLAKLSDKLGIQRSDLDTWLTDRARRLSSRVAADDLTDLRKLVRTFDNVAEQRFDVVAGAGRRLDSAWMRVTFGVVAFYLATAPLLKDLATLKKTRTKDWLSLVGSVAGAAEMVADLKEAREIVKGANGRVANSATAASFARTCGVVAGAIGVITSLMELDAALASRDADKIMLTWTGTLVGVTGFVASVVSVTMLSGVLAVVGVALTVTAAVLLNESPVAPYLRRTPWGTDQLTAWGLEPGRAIPVSKVIDEYYQTYFTLKVALDATADNDPCVVVGSRALAKSTPIRLTVAPVAGGGSDRVAFMPFDRRVDGRGRVRTPSFSWSGQGAVAGPKEVRIHRPWEVWPSIEMDGETAYRIEAEMEVDPTCTLTGEANGVVFPALRAALARHADHVGSIDMFEDDVVVAFPPFISYPPTGYLRLNVWTKFTVNCRVNVTAAWDADDVQEGDEGSETHARAVEDAYDRFVKTTVPVRVSRPSDGAYEVQLRWVLLASDDTEIDAMETTIRIAPP